MAAESRRIIHLVGTKATLDSGARQGLLAYESDNGLTVRYQWGPLLANTAYLARRDAAQTFTGTQTFSGTVNAQVGLQVAGTLRISSGGAGTLTSLTVSGLPSSFTRDTVLGTEAYYNAPIYVQRASIGGTEYHCGIGFHNPSSNGAYLYLDSGTHNFKYVLSTGLYRQIWDTGSLIGNQTDHWHDAYQPVGSYATCIWQGVNLTAVSGDTFASMLSGGASSGTLTLPANTLAAGRVLRVKAALLPTAGSVTPFMRISLGGVVVAQFSNFNSLINNSPYLVEILLSAGAAPGAAVTVYGAGSIVDTSGQATQHTITSASIATNAAQAIAIEGTAGTGATMNLTIASIELL